MRGTKGVKEEVLQVLDWIGMRKVLSTRYEYELMFTLLSFICFHHLTGDHPCHCMNLCISGFCQILLCGFHRHFILNLKGLKLKRYWNDHQLNQQQFTLRYVSILGGECPIECSPLSVCPGGMLRMLTLANFLYYRCRRPNDAGCLVSASTVNFVIKKQKL